MFGINNNFKIIGPVLLLFVWWIAIFIDTKMEMKPDVDLGIASADLSFAGAAIWSLPLALFLWLINLFGIWLILLVVQIWRKHTSETR